MYIAGLITPVAEDKMEAYRKWAKNVVPVENQIRTYLVFAEIRSNTPQAASCQGLGRLQPVLHQFVIPIIARAYSLDGGAR